MRLGKTIKKISSYHTSQGTSSSNSFRSPSNSSTQLQHPTGSEGAGPQTREEKAVLRNHMGWGMALEEKLVRGV